MKTDPVLVWKQPTKKIDPFLRDGFYTLYDKFRVEWLLDHFDEKFPPNLMLNGYYDNIIRDMDTIKDNRSVFDIMLYNSITDFILLERLVLFIDENRPDIQAKIKPAFNELLKFLLNKENQEKLYQEYLTKPSMNDIIRLQEAELINFVYNGLKFSLMFESHRYNCFGHINKIPKVRLEISRYNRLYDIADHSTRYIYRSDDYLITKTPRLYPENNLNTLSFLYLTDSIRVLTKLLDVNIDQLNNYLSLYNNKK